MMDYRESIVQTLTTPKEPMQYGPGTMFLLGVRVDNITGATAMKLIRDRLTGRDGSLTGKVFFTNVHTIHLARREASFLQIVNQADLVLADGSGLKLAGRLMNKPIVENLNGTDFVPVVLKEAEIHQWSVYLLGGRPMVTQRCLERLQELFPGLRIVGRQHGHFSTAKEEEAIIGEINNVKPDILLVALGSPFQEQWISRNAHRLDAGLSFGVGGLFDFLSGQRKRAPSWMRSLGIEWVYRFLQDPQTKWNRVFVEIPLFVAVLLVKSLFPKGLQGAAERSGQTR